MSSIIDQFNNQSHHLGRELFQRRNTSAARLWCSAPLLAPPLQPLYRRCHAHIRQKVRRLGKVVAVFDAVTFVFGIAE